MVNRKKHTGTKVFCGPVQGDKMTLAAAFFGPRGLGWLQAWPEARASMSGVRGQQGRECRMGSVGMGYITGPAGSPQPDHVCHSKT